MVQFRPLLLLLALGARRGCRQQGALRSGFAIEVVHAEFVGVCTGGVSGEGLEEAFEGVHVSVEPVVGDAHNPIDWITLTCHSTVQGGQHVLECRAMHSGLGSGFVVVDVVMDGDQAVLRRDACAVSCLVLDAMAVFSVPVEGDAAVEDDRSLTCFPESQYFRHLRGARWNAAEAIEQKFCFRGLKPRLRALFRGGIQARASVTVSHGEGPIFLGGQALGRDGSPGRGPSF